VGCSVPQDVEIPELRPVVTVPVVVRNFDEPIPADQLKITFAVRASNPIHLLTVKVVDVDGSVYEKQLPMSTNWLEWQEFTIRWILRFAFQVQLANGGAGQRRCVNVVNQPV